MVEVYTAASTASRGLLVVALLCAFVYAQAAASIFPHSHQNLPRHRCWLCQVDPSPVLQPAVSALPTPGIEMTWLERSTSSDAPRELLPAARYSRGPPA